MASSELLAGEGSDLLFWRNFPKFMCLTTFPNSDFHTENVLYRRQLFKTNFPTKKFLTKFSNSSLKFSTPIFRLKMFYTDFTASNNFFTDTCLST